MRRSRFSDGQHDWISLLDISGPFLSIGNLQKTFPMGLENLTAGLRQQFQLAFEEWYSSEDPRIHSAWVQWVLTSVLEFDDEVLLDTAKLPEDLNYRDEASQEIFQPTYLIVSAEDEPKPLMPILVVPKKQKLGQPLSQAPWVASPNQRMQALLRTSKLTHGLVTNGSEWTLVHVREGDASGYITFRADVLSDEEGLLRAFVSCLGLRRVVGAAPGESLADLLLASRDDEEELTLDLGKQVRQSVELLVRELDRLDENTGRQLLLTEENEHLYRGCLTVMMRLMFLLCAEERKLLPIDDSEPYAECYAASTLLSQLELEVNANGEEILERRYDAWVRLLATARLLHQGSPLPELQMTAYGGSLFDPEQYPFLETLKINNRVTLHMLESLQYILVDGVGGKERRRISFEALDVEQIGYVYEGLLDHTIQTAGEPVLGLIGKSTYEPELSLTTLEAEKAKGEKALLKFLKKETDRSEKAIEKLLQAPIDKIRESGLRTACGGDTALYDRVKPWGNLVRLDTLGRFQVYLAGSRYVTNSDERRGTGTHYTPRFLAEEMVEHTLEPLIVEGMAEGLPQDQWRKKSATELLNLRVADIAMGSGAFLVAVCRYLSAKVVEAWNDAERAVSTELGGARLVCTEAGELQLAFDPQSPERKPSQKVLTQIGELAVADPKRNEALPLDESERLAVARSMVVDRCLYGVDINPMAAEMAKLSLWLITMRRNHPFHFLDHALKCGDSLVGITLEELRSFSFDSGQYGGLLLPWVPEAVARVTNLREQIRKTPSDTVIGVQARRALHDRAEEDEAALRVAADLLLVDEFQASEASAVEARLAMLQERPNRERAKRLGSVLGRASFHFQLEFTDVFSDGGFDSVVGNPPFVGGGKMTRRISTEFREYIIRRIAFGDRGSADLCAYFFLQAVRLVKVNGTIGLLAINTISEGDTREVGLHRILGDSNTNNFDVAPATAYRAVKAMKWPSKSANILCAKVWMIRGEWKGTRILEKMNVPRITSYLDDGETGGQPFKLEANLSLSFTGTKLTGMGFSIPLNERVELLSLDASYELVARPYINGDEFNSNTDQKASRAAIAFYDWPLGRVSQKMPLSGELVLDLIKRLNRDRSDSTFPKATSSWNLAPADLQRKWLQLGVVPDDYTDHVAADFPKALEIIEDRVMSARLRPAKNGPEKSGRNYQLSKPLPERFWQHERSRLEMYAAIASLPRCLCRSQVSEYALYSWLPTSYLLDQRLIVFASSADWMLSVLQSAWHGVWADKYQASLVTRPTYTPSDCFETFPLPQFSLKVDAAGKELHDARSKAMQTRGVGLTDLAKRTHNPSCKDADVEAIRQAMVANDFSVGISYGWDVDLDHAFHQEGRVVRFGVSATARKQMLRLLLEENHRRYAEEQETAKKEPKAKKPKPTRLFDDGGLFGSGNLMEEES